MEATMSVRFTHSRRGARAWLWARGRWWPTPVEGARLLLATERAKDVTAEYVATDTPWGRRFHYQKPAEAPAARAELALCPACLGVIGGAFGGPDAPYRAAGPGEACGAADCAAAPASETDGMTLDDARRIQARERAAEDGWRYQE